MVVSFRPAAGQICFVCRLFGEELTYHRFEVSRPDGVQLGEGVIVRRGVAAGIGEALAGCLVDRGLEERLPNDAGVADVRSAECGLNVLVHSDRRVWQAADPSRGPLSLPPPSSPVEAERWLVAVFVDGRL